MSQNPNPAQVHRTGTELGWTEPRLDENFSRLARRIDTSLGKAPYLLGIATDGVGTAAATTETTLLEVTLPSRFLGPRGALRITAGATGSGTADDRTVSIRFGDGTGGAGDPVLGGHTIVGGNPLDAALLTAYLVNLNDVAAQRAHVHTVVDTGISILDTTTTTVDTDATPTGQPTGAALHVRLTGQTANAADEVTGVFLLVESLPRQGAA